MAMAAPLANSPVLHYESLLLLLPSLPKTRCRRMSPRLATPLPFAESSLGCKANARNRIVLVSATASPIESVEAATNDGLVSTIESAASPIQSIPTTSDNDLISTIESGLFFIAFLALSILTVGVIYIAITDFLDKRENEKFQKEEAAANKKKTRGGKKGKVSVGSARNGPRGFGQQQQQEQDS